MVEITSVAILIAFVMGGTELVKQAFDKNWRVVAIIVVAVLIGGLAGVFLLTDIGLALGMFYGLSASGVITGLQKFGHGTAAPGTAKEVLPASK